MVSAPEALRISVRDGILERKVRLADARGGTYGIINLDGLYCVLAHQRRAGYWTKRQFVLTPTHLMHFESLHAKEPANSFATMEIMAVQKNASDLQQRVFALVLFKKKKEYKAKSREDRDAWVEAFESVSGMKGSRPSPQSVKIEDMSTHDVPTATEERQKDSTEDRSSRSNVHDIKDVDLRALSEQMKKSFSWQIQINRSFSSKDVVEFVRKTLPCLPTAQIPEVGQALIDLKLIIPLKSHVFDVADSGRYKFREDVAPKQCQNLLNLQGASIANLMGNEPFDARKYAEEFLRKHSPLKIDTHCKKLVAQKEHTIEDLKEEISANYTSFICAADEIKSMENSVLHLKTLVSECRRSMHSLTKVTLEPLPENKMRPDVKARDKRAEVSTQSLALDEFIYDLEVYLYERNYEQFTQHMLEYKRKETQGLESASDTQQRKIDELRLLLVTKLVDEFNASLQTSERMHKKENHLELLIQLGETQLATEMCLQHYSVRIALQLRHVPSYGNALNYIINFARIFFTSLLACYEDFEHSFCGQKSCHFISLTVWISAQLEHFASEVTYHIFPHDPAANIIRNKAPGDDASLSATCVAVDVSEFKSVAKYVSSALRYVFYGARQLELSGLPTAHYLAPHLAQGLVSFFTSYGVAIKNTIREEIKRERWEMTSRTIRDPDNKEEREIVLTQSARSFYALVQQFLRDAQRVIHPSCATSNLPRFHDVVVWEAHELLVRFCVETLQYLESPKLSSSLRPKQIIGILTNVAYIQDDCATRSSNILQEFLPKIALQNREVKTQMSTLWNQLIAIGVKRYAQAQMKMSLSWQDIELADEALADLADAPPSSIFALVVAKELANVFTNDQLNKAVRNGSDDALMQAIPDGADEGASDAFVIMALCALLREILDDEPWWHNFDIKKGAKRKELGYGGMNKFLAEIHALRSIVPANKCVVEMTSNVDAKMVELYQQLHPETKDVRAPAQWTQAFASQCIAAAAPSTE